MTVLHLSNRQCRRMVRLLGFRWAELSIFLTGQTAHKGKPTERFGATSLAEADNLVRRWTNERNDLSDILGNLGCELPPISARKVFKTVDGETVFNIHHSQRYAMQLSDVIVDPFLDKPHTDPQPRHYTAAGARS